MWEGLVLSKLHFFSFAGGSFFLFQMKNKRVEFCSIEKFRFFFKLIPRIVFVLHLNNNRPIKRGVKLSQKFPFFSNKFWRNSRLKTPSREWPNQILHCHFLGQNIMLFVRHLKRISKKIFFFVIRKYFENVKRRFLNRQYFPARCSNR